MTPTAPEFFSIRIEDFEPSWVGQNPFTSGFAIGAADGAIAFTNELGVESHHIKSPAKDAITGLANLNEYLAISTGQEVSVLVLPQGDGEKTLCSTLPHGAHGIVATSSGHFIAPVGHDGLMLIKPSHKSNVDYRINAFQEPELNFYQLCQISQYNGKDYCVAACRSRGLGLIDYSQASSEMGLQIGNSEGVDVVDVISLGTSDYPFAIASVGIRGEIWLCRDIIRQEPPIMLNYQSFAGRVYRILSAYGHLFVLTSKAVYVLADLANRLVQPVFNKSNSPVMTIPMEAVDATIVDGKWLLVVMPDLVRRYDIESIHQRIAGFAGNEVAHDFVEATHQNWGRIQGGPSSTHVEPQCAVV